MESRQLAVNRAFYSNSRRIDRWATSYIVRLGGSLLHSPSADEKQLNFTRLQALEWLCQTAAALKYLHNMEPRPIVHRDLKPDNILLTSNRSRVKLADFGISTEWRTHMTSNQGTPSYIAPEVSKRAEIYCGDTFTAGVHLQNSSTDDRKSHDIFGI